MSDKQVATMSIGLSAAFLAMAVFEVTTTPTVTPWLILWTVAAGLFGGFAVYVQRPAVSIPARTPKQNRGDMGADLKQMYESVSIALDNASDARDALLQFCAANGYRALQQGQNYFVQDVRTSRVYRAEFAKPAKR